MSSSALTVDSARSVVGPAPIRLYVVQKPSVLAFDETGFDQFSTEECLDRPV